MKQKTPRFWTRLLKFFCKESLHEELQGDLEEVFYANIESKGLREAKSIYRKEVIKMLRPSVVKSVKSNSRLYNLSLFKIHWVLSVRSFRKNKVFSLVTTLGFAAAISISLFLINIIYSGYSLDRQHNDPNGIYRVATMETENGEIKKFASSPFELKEQITDNVPGFELLSHVNRTLATSFQIGGSAINLNGVYVDENFFKIFNFPSIKGNPADIFKDRNSIIITDEAAQKLFDGQNPIGQITNQGQVVRAVVASPKNKSHIPFEVIGNIDSFSPDLKNGDYKSRNYLYGRIAENVAPETLESRLESFPTRSNDDLDDVQREHSFFLQSIDGIMFKDGVFNEIGSSVGREGLIMFVSLTLVLIAMACFNYTNLSMARALQRTREVGIRKVAGSTRRQIIGQFLIETFLFSSMGFLVGLSIYVYYSNRISDVIPFPFLEITDYNIIFLFIGFSIITSLTAGIFPALFFAKISPLALFNKQLSKGKISLQGIRKLLVGFQLTVSMFMIILLSLIIDQNQSLRNSPMGIESDQLLVVSSTPETVDLLKQGFEKISGVSSSTVVSSLPVVDFPVYLNLYKEGMADSLATRFIQVDADFDKVFQPKLKSGSFFSPQLGQQDYQEIVVSSALLEKMGIPENEALGTLLSSSAHNYQITGILDQTISANPLIKQDESLLLINSNQPMQYARLVLRLEGKDLTHTLNQIQTEWEAIFIDGSFQATFLNSEIDSTFGNLLNAIRIITFIGGCIILISMLGQLGMALFNAQSRMKEIGIRKVMGAAMGRIIGLILKSTTITIIIAAFIATPIAYVVFKYAVAADVRTPLEITPWLLLKGVLVLTLLVVGVVVSQTWKVASANPTQSLRNE
tara:strand:+ start:6780 stop:9359 length:2580 start_codon:yes stop_codon:yes gene_type:complete